MLSYAKPGEYVTAPEKEAAAQYAGNRINLTDEEHKNTCPDIDRTDVVFTDGGVSYTVGVTEDEKNNVNKAVVVGKQNKDNWYCMIS